MANSYDPLSIFSTVTTFLTTGLLPAVAGLVVLGITVRIAFKAVKNRANGVH
jgi:hypothetical protein